eukprot:CCRYP_017121-RA/>CCRYP_017121-RA protein AED:0.38 eAED:0.37 QI:0/0/0/1/0/0/2/0/159
MVNAGTSEFKTAISEAGYRSQVCQHAAATGINNVLMVYCAPGALVKQMILRSLRMFQSLVTSKYMSFAYSLNAGDIPYIGNDYSPAYGYGQEHDTLVLWLNLWIAHECDVIENGTPPACGRLIDQPTSAWNKCMGNIDTIRNVLSGAMTIRGQTVARPH